MSTMIVRAKLAESLGYDKVWLADERFYRDVYSCLSIFAVNTRRVKLGTCVTDPFSRHPAPTAMAIGTLDEISNGRAILKQGLLGFDALGIVPNKPPRAIRESIETIRMLLTGQQVDYHGEIIQSEDSHPLCRYGHSGLRCEQFAWPTRGRRCRGRCHHGSLYSVLEVKALKADSHARRR